MDWVVYRDFPAELQPEWDQLLEESITQVPFLRYEYMQIWWRNLGGGEWKDAQLALTIARKDRKLMGIAPLFFTKDLKGYPVLMFLGSIEISDYLDVIVRETDLAEFIDGLYDFIHQPAFPEWKGLEFYNILDTSPTLKAFQETVQKNGNHIEVSHLQHSPYIPLPGDFELYLAGIDKKQRHEIRRKMRRAEESDSEVKWYLSQDASLLENDIEEFLKLMTLDDKKKTFLTPKMREQFLQIIHWGFSDGILHLAFLEVNGEKAAAHFSFYYQNRLWAYNSGFNPKFIELSPGWVLLGLELRWANEHGI